MKRVDLSKRHTVLMYDDVFEGIFLNVHIIQAVHRNYIIDTGMGYDYYVDIMDVVEDTDKPLVIINTHDHWDHVWANGYFKTNMIVSHELAYKGLCTHGNEDIIKYGNQAKGDISFRLPTVTFKDELIFEDDGIVCKFTPGHSHSDIYVYDREEGILNAGDNIGDTDDEPIPYLDTDIHTYQQTLTEFIELKPKYIISGHNNIKEPEFLETIEGCIRKIQQ